MRRWLPALCAAALLSPVLPARALVPYVYVPTSEELNDAGVNIAGAFDFQMTNEFCVGCKTPDDSIGSI